MWKTTNTSQEWINSDAMHSKFMWTGENMYAHKMVKWVRLFCQRWSILNWNCKSVIWSFKQNKHIHPFYSQFYVMCKRIQPLTHVTLRPIFPNANSEDCNATESTHSLVLSHLTFFLPARMLVPFEYAYYMSLHLKAQGCFSIFSCRL